MASQRPPIVPGPRLPRIARALARLLLRPMIVAVLLGLALALTDLPLPDLLAAPLTQVGQATPTLAFLTIGLGLDLRSLRGHALALAGIAGIKLLVMPALVAGILLALEVRGDVAHAAVLQAAMPTAVVSAIIASDAGCDPRLASAAAVVTTLLALATLPLIAACLPAIGL
jgi:predicted permease